MEELTQQYLTQLLPQSTGWAERLEADAKADHVPIMDPLGIRFLTQLIRIQQPKRILEVGTAIGYSALKMLEASPEATIVTMERDEQRYQEAIRNIAACDKATQIHVQLGDALEYMERLRETAQQFDFIFIDAAKGQYGKFFDLAHDLLASEGSIVTDNVLFRGYVAGSGDIPKKYINMVKKLRAYNEMLMNHPDYSTTIMPIGDGVAVSLRLS